MNLSFQEKSLWLMFVSLVGAFAFYFYFALGTVLPVEAAVDVMPHQVALFVVAVVMLVVIQIVGHIVIAIADRRTETDERDRLIALKGTRNAACVLATGVFLALCAALVTQGNFIFTHVLLAFWVLAQLVEIGSQLFLYRRGA
jgi:hypothetical protein